MTVVLSRGSSWKCLLELTRVLISQANSWQQGEPIVVAALKACGVLKFLEAGERIHDDVCGDEWGIYTATALVDMFGKCGSMGRAQGVFDRMNHRDTVSWNALILGYAVNGEEELALELVQRMNESGYVANDRTFVAGLMACNKLSDRETGTQVGGRMMKLRCLEKGFELHSRAAKLHWDTDVFVANSLVCLYCKCGSLVDARVAFDRMSGMTVVSWTALMLGFVDNGESSLALEMFFNLMAQSSEMVNSRTLMAALMACSSLAASESGTLVDGKVMKLASLEIGRSIHSEVARRRVWDAFVASTLIDMYRKCGSLADALAIFEGLKERDVVSWTTIIQGHAENGEGQQALKLFRTMQCEGCAPNVPAFAVALRACGSLAEAGECLEIGKRIHLQAEERGYESDPVVGNTVIGMYAKCGSLADAHKVFDRMRHRDTVSWTTLMLAYSECGEAEACLALFWKMVSEGCALDSQSFLAPVMSAASLAESEVATRAGDLVFKSSSLDMGMRIHSEVVRSCRQPDVYLAAALVDMYGKCGSMYDARRAFERTNRHDAVLWNTLMLGYVANSEPELVFEVFSGMNCSPDCQSYVAAFTALAASALKEEAKRAGSKLVKLECLSKGMFIHLLAAKNGKEADIFVSNTLVDMYGKCGSLYDARRVFDRMKAHDLVSWNSLLLASCESRDSELALELFSCMKDQGLEPDSRTLVAALMACSSSVNLEAGRAIHSHICRSGVENNAAVASQLVDFYGKCGRIIASELVFDSAVINGTCAWNSLLAGLSRAGDSRRVFEVFDRMLEQGVHPDSSTMHLLLTTCSHSGEIHRGINCFETMSRAHAVAPSPVHLRCMVDLLGRANRLEEAVALLRDHLQADALAWTSFLASCAKWKDVRLGELAYETLLRLDSGNAGAYILMANLYAL